MCPLKENRPQTRRLLVSPPELRPAGWIDKGDEGTKGREKEHWRDRAALTKKEEMSRGFSIGRALSIFYPISEGNNCNSQTLDPMQAMFKEFTMWYSKQNMDGNL
jgi:hypothetical protein